MPPLGILYVGDALKKAGYEVRVSHFTPDEIPRQAEIISRGKPLFVGISAFTSNQTRFGARFSRLFRERCESPVVWGGVHASMGPEQTLGEEYVDIVVIGEGEETAVDLARTLESGVSLGGVTGIGFKDNGEPVFNEPRPLIENLDRYRLDWDLVDIENYLTPAWGRKRVINFITSRGCPFKCGFCYNQRFNRRRWRSHSREFVISEIQELKGRYGIDGIKFYDDNFFANKKRAVEILKAVDLPWEGQLRIGYITGELAETLDETLCQGICFGFESGSDRILELIRKDQTTEDIIRGTAALAKYPAIRVTGCFILGNPTETREEVRKTIDFCLKLLEIHPKMSFSLGAFLPFPGVPLYDLLVDEGFVAPERTEDWEVINRMNDEMELPWLSWVTKEERENFVRAGRYAKLLQLRYLKIPVINKIPVWRLSSYNFRFPLELPALEWIHRTYSDEGSPLSKIMRKTVALTRSRSRVRHS